MARGCARLDLHSLPLVRCCTTATGSMQRVPGNLQRTALCGRCAGVVRACCAGLFNPLLNPLLNPFSYSLLRCRTLLAVQSPSRHQGTACMRQATTACMQQTTTACMQQTTTYAIQRPIGELTTGGTGRHAAVPIVPLSLAADGPLWVAGPIARANWFAFPPFRLSPCNRQHTTSSRQRPTGATTNGRHAPIASPFRRLRFCAEPLLPDHTRCGPRPRRDPLHGTVQLPVPRRAHAVVWPATVLCTAAAICLHFEWRPGPSRNVLDSAATDNAATESMQRQHTVA